MFKPLHKASAALLIACLICLPASAANRTAWTAGNGQGLASWGLLFNTTDFSTSHAGGFLQNADTVLSSVTAIANGTNLDQFMDISCQLTIGSSTTAAGANLTFWLFALQQDGTTYGDGHFTAGTSTTIVPVWAPIAVIPLYAAASQTTIIGEVNGIVIPPESFAVAIQNNTGFTLASTNACKYKTYNINLNN